MKINGKALKEIRTHLDIPLEKVALAADLSSRRIQQIETGEIANVNLNVAKSIANILGVKLDAIAVPK